MLTDAMMLVSPFHADYEFLTRPYHEEAPELWDTEGAGLAGLDQEVVATLLEESFEVVDAASAIEWCDSLEAEAGLWPDSSLVAAHVPAVSMLAGSAVAAGFDCCRVINILTSARAAGYIYNVLENADTDVGTFLRARALAHEVFWLPVDAAGTGGVFEDLRSARVPL